MLQLVNFDLFWFCLFFYFRRDDWVLNFRIELNSVYNIRKAVILYFIKLQQRNEKNSVKSYKRRFSPKRINFIIIFLDFRSDHIRTYARAYLRHFNAIKPEVRESRNE